MYLLLIFLCLFSSLSLMIFGRFINKHIASYIVLSCIFLSFIFSIFIFYEIIYLDSICIILLPLLWFNIDILRVEWIFIFDSISITMLIVIFFISFLVHLYSIEYMNYDPHIVRFLSYLSFFTFFMILLITSGNLIQLFLGWEGVGLSSYLLINFWFTRFQANKSAFKAMIINRIGDLGLAFGIFLIFFFFKTIDFYTFFSLSFYFLNIDFVFLSLKINLADFISFFLFLGVIGKSAQFGLHTWLPDAMEGPTPVSALLHAATMVTAGIFLIVRLSYIFEHSILILSLICFIGGLTAFFASIIASFQTDFKKIIAYSTSSQLGYMVLACGFSLYSSSIFHFFNHAFFKALLFLSAGSVIHALSNEQNIFKLGNLSTYLPFTTQMCLIGIISLISLPFFSGFYSKDWILEIINSIFFFDSIIIIFLSFYAAIFTIIYNNNLFLIIFYEDEKYLLSQIILIKESKYKILLPLGILSLLSIFSGFLFKDLFIGYDTFIWKNSIFVLIENFYFYEIEFLSVFIKILPLILNIFILIVIYFSFDFLLKINNLIKLLIFNKKSKFYFDFLTLNMFYDSVLNYFIINYFLNFCKELIFKLLDKGLFEFFGPYGILNNFNIFKKKISFISSGYIYHYTFIIFIFIITFSFLNIFVLENLINDFIIFQIGLIFFFFMFN